MLQLPAIGAVLAACNDSASRAHKDAQTGDAIRADGNSDIDAAVQCEVLQHPTDIVPSYNAPQFLFEAVTFTATFSTTTPASSLQWQKKMCDAAPWLDITGATGDKLTVLPTWKDIGAKFRLMCSSGTPTEAGTLLPPALQGLDPANYGATGNGREDDTTALIATMTAAAASNSGVDLNGRTYAVSGNVWIRNGVSAVFGGTIRQIAKQSALFLRGRAQGETSNVQGIVLRDLTIQHSGGDDIGIRVDNASSVAIVDCRFEGLSQGYSVYCRARKDGVDDMQNLVIARNVVLAMQDGPIEAIHVSSELNTGLYASQLDHWKATKTLATTYGSVHDVYVGCNDVDGGYYGISLDGVSNYLVEFNKCTNNVRNLSAQNQSNHGIIRYNDFRDSKSASIHLAYGSSDNKIHDNTITTVRSEGEGLLQCYVATERNNFHDNTTHAQGDGPKWHAYCAVHANDNVFANNHFNGSCRRAYMVLEAAWDSTNTHPAHRAKGLPEVNNFANANSANNRFSSNAIASTSAVEAICLAEVQDAFGTWLLPGTVVENNLVSGPAISAPHTYTG